MNDIWIRLRLLHIRRFAAASDSDLHFGIAPLKFGSERKYKICPLALGEAPDHENVSILRKLRRSGHMAGGKKFFLNSIADDNDPRRIGSKQRLNSPLKKLRYGQHFIGAL